MNGCELLLSSIMLRPSINIKMFFMILWEMKSTKLINSWSSRKTLNMCKGDEILCNKERKKMFHLLATMFRFALVWTSRNAMIFVIKKKMAMKARHCWIINLHFPPRGSSFEPKGSLSKALCNSSRIEPQASPRSASSSENEWNLTLVKKLPLVRDLQSMKVSSKNPEKFT